MSTLIYNNQKIIANKNYSKISFRIMTENFRGHSQWFFRICQTMHMLYSFTICENDGKDIVSYLLLKISDFSDAIQVQLIQRFSSFVNVVVLNTS